MENLYKKFLSWFSSIESQRSNLEKILNDYLSFLKEVNLHIERANFGTTTLHPEIQTLAFTWTSHEKHSSLDIDWEHQAKMTKFVSSSGVLYRRGFRFGSLENPEYLKSPIAQLAREGKVIQSKLNREIGDEEFPIYHELKAKGFTEYIAIPFSTGKGIGVFMSFATTVPNGIDSSSLEFLIDTSQLIAMRWEKLIQQEIMENLLKTYLGKKTGPRVLSGKVRRGDLDKINAIIWISDIRDFTKLSQLLSAEDLVLYLNQYFEIVLPIIERTGGEVLKLIGDAVLAVYPFQEKNKRNVHFRALVAARQTDQALEKLNLVHQTENKPNMMHGVGLNYGTVLYGNIGSVDRLDFTVIGTAVNETSRIAGLCSSLGKTLLASEEFAKEAKVPWVDMGYQNLKGFDNPKKIFGL